VGLSRQVAIVAAGRVATTTSIFAVNALLARTWALDDFGVFSAIWILGNTLAPMFLAGIPTALLYAFPRRAQGEERRDLVWQSTLVLCLSASLLIVLLWSVGTLVSGWLSLSVAAHVLVPFLPYVFSVVAAGHVEAALVASGRPTWQAWLSLCGALGLVLVACLAFNMAWSVEDALLALSVVGLSRCGLGWLLLAAGMGVAIPSTSGIGSLLRYAGQIGLNDAVGSLSRAVDRMVILGFLGTADLALYHVGAVEAPVSLILAAVVTVLVPEVSRLSEAGKTKQIALLFRGAVGRLALVILPVFCFLFVHADTVIEVYLPVEFSRATGVFRIFLLALPLRCAVYNPILVGTGRAHWALYGSLGDLCVNVLLSVALVQWLMAASPYWALLAPALATVLATWLQVVALLLLLARSLGQPWRTILPWGRLSRVFLVSGLAAVASGWLVSDLALSAMLRLCAALLVFLPLGAGLLRSWCPVDWQELIGLRRAISGSQAAQ
jgi:O-antigen/teichoic acid export membrane protein